MWALTQLEGGGDVTPVTQAITFAIVGGFFAVITLILNNRQSRQVKQEDWHREDVVAARAEAAAKAQLEATTRLAAEQAVTSTTMRSIDSKQDIIHDLVNSQYTAAMESEYAALVGQLAMMNEVTTLRGGPVSQATATAAASLGLRVEELGRVLVERRQNDEVALEAARAASGDRSAAETQQAAADQQTAAAELQHEAALAQAAIAEVPRVPADGPTVSDRTGPAGA